jgi:hypothetical protein
METLYKYESFPTLLYKPNTELTISQFDSILVEKLILELINLVDEISCSLE